MKDEAKYHAIVVYYLLTSASSIKKYFQISLLFIEEAEVYFHF